jgi:hypothetical protein
MFKVSTLSFHAGIAGNRLLGTYFLPPCLTGAVYHNFLQNVLPELLQDVVLQTRIHLWFMHDGAPPHFLLAVRQFLNNVFPEQWIEQGGPTAWPGSSPDLSPLHFHLWGHLKSTVCATKVSDAQDLQQQIQNGFVTICTTTGIFQ